LQQKRKNNRHILPVDEKRRSLSGVFHSRTNSCFGGHERSGAESLIHIGNLASNAVGKIAAQEGAYIADFFDGDVLLYRAIAEQASNKNALTGQKSHGMPPQMVAISLQLQTLQPEVVGWQGANIVCVLCVRNLRNIG
jgi:hypothetical protein